MTDLEFYEIRYSGGAARRAARVPRRLSRPVLQLHDHGDGEPGRVQDRGGAVRPRALADADGSSALLNVVFAAHSGLWGVLVIDMIQFFIKMTAVIAAAYFAVNAPQVGGLHAMIQKLSATPGPGGLNYLHVLPDFTNNWDLAVAIFIMPIAVQWWAVWYPGVRARRRQLHRAAHAGVEIGEGRARRRALLQHGALRHPALAVDPRRPGSLIVYPQLSDIQRAFPHLDPRPDRPRHRVPRDAEVSAGRIHRADGGRPDRGELVDDPDASQLGRVVSRPRLLSPLHQAATRRSGTT